MNKSTSIKTTQELYYIQKRELTNAKKVQQNIEDAIEALQSSLVVLESANKVNEQLEQKNTMQH